MLEMKTECEHCHDALIEQGEVYICSYECTFCVDCCTALGGLFVAVTVFLPQGLVGLVSQRWAALRKQFPTKKTNNDTLTPAEGEAP